MIIKKIKKHGIENITYTGEIDNSLIRLVFEDGAVPVEGSIKVLVGKLVTKNDQNFYYIKSYKVVEG
jgi:hypothetical protein